jgi:hypothetical protein
MKSKYIEKATGKWWTVKSECVSYSRPEESYMLLCEYDDTDGNTLIKLHPNKVKERFDYIPWPKPNTEIETVVPRHPVHIVLKCPICGSVLKTVGGAICTSPLQYEHKCSNPDCKYEQCTKTIFSGMYAAVTDEQERLIQNGEYDEFKHGDIIELRERDMWSFK